MRTGTPRLGVPSLRNRLRRGWDRPLVGYVLLLSSTALITGLGLMMVFSASQVQALRYDLPATFYFRKQLLAAVVGAGLLVCSSRMPVRTHRRMAYPLFGGVFLALALVQLPGVGQTVNGSTNWLALGGSFQFQPSEFAKLAFLLWGADLLARKHRTGVLARWKHLLIPLAPCALLLAGLVLLGGDLGTTAVLCAVLFALLWLTGVPTRVFGGVLVLAFLAGTLLVATSAHRMSRLTCLGASDPGPHDQCWQVVHGLYAFSSGGLFGAGIGAGTQKWGQLPEPHTDFIFAVTGEELGLAGTLSLLVLFAALLAAGIRTAQRVRAPFARLAACGITVWIATQAVINIGGALGVLPITGVPLPLFSYGGSALVPTLWAVGLLVALAREEPAARAVLARGSRVSWSIRGSP